MSKIVTIRKSIRQGARGPRLRLHFFINGVSYLSIVFTSGETKALYNLIQKHMSDEP